MEFIQTLSIFVMAVFVGYYVVWSVTPALHTPLMAVTNAISSVIIVGALIAAAAAAAFAPAPCHRIYPSAQGQSANIAATPRSGTIADIVEESPNLPSCAAQDPAILPVKFPWSKWLGLLAVVLASVNIFGGFAVTARMLAMYKKKVR